MKKNSKNKSLQSIIFNTARCLFSQIIDLKHFTLTCIVLSLMGCNGHTWEVEVSTVLSLAGSNRGELEEVLRHYSKVEPNKAKLQAARFLIANMRWHKSFVPIHKDPTFLLDSLTKSADSLYYQYIKDISLDSVNTVAVREQLTSLRKDFLNKNSALMSNDSISVTMNMKYDFEKLTAKELITHIDYAFSLRSKNPQIKKLSREDFYEYILPYRSIPDYPLVDLPETHRQLLGKYMENVPVDSIEKLVNQYHYTLRNLKNFFPSYPYKEKVGCQELFFRGCHDCIDIAHFGNSTLRNKGIPSAVEYNAAYKELQGHHYMCSLLAPNGQWINYSPEMSIPSPEQNNFWADNGALNIYRFMFSNQKEAPFLLREQEEYVPEELNNPFIKDVTSHHLPTTAIQLPFQVSCKNKLAYLATFSSASDNGIIPVTWGVINHKKQNVCFQNVVMGRLYFPIYYNATGQWISFAPPFYLNKSGEKIAAYPSVSSPASTHYLTRKFPMKLKLLEKAQGLMGTVFLASDNPSFNPADTVGSISSLLKPHFQDLPLDISRGPYQHYRVKATDSIPHACISEIQFLTERKYHYPNTQAASQLPIFHPVDTLRQSTSLVRLMDNPFEKIKWKFEYDGNPQTSPGAYPTINFTLKKPQYVTAIRLMPLNADNGITINDRYRLLQWRDGKWKVIGEQIARHNFLTFHLSEGQIYWLQNQSKGREELPFTIDRTGKQLFIYQDIMND